VRTEVGTPRPALVHSLLSGQALGRKDPVASVIRAAILLLVAAVPTFGQTVRVKLMCRSLDVYCEAMYGVKSRQAWSESLAVRHRTADRKWDTVTAVSATATILDVQYSLHELHLGATEANPLFGKHPSGERYYAIDAPMAIGAAYLHWRFKRQDDALRDAGLPTTKKAWLPQASNIGYHLFGFVFTYAHRRRF